MAYLLSPGVLATEQSFSLTVPAVSTTTAATVIASEWGRCEEIVSLFSENDILSQFYKPTISHTDPLQSTYLDFFTMANFFAYGNNLKVVRLVGDNARNANVAIVDGQVSFVSDLIIKNDKEFESRRNSGLLQNIAFAAKYPSSLGNSIAVSIADKYSFPHWQFKTTFDYPPGEGEFSLVVLDTAKAWQTDAYLSVIEKFEGLSFKPGDRKYDGSSKFYKTAINNGSSYIWAGEKDISDILSGKQYVHDVSISDVSVALTAGSVISGASRIVTFIPLTGATTTVQPTQYLVSGHNLIVKPEVIPSSGQINFNQIKSTTYPVSPGMNTPLVVTSAFPFGDSDVIELSFLGDSSSSSIIVDPVNYSIGRSFIVGEDPTPTPTGSDLAVTPTPTGSDLAVTPTPTPTGSFIAASPTPSSSAVLNIVTIDADTLTESGVLTVKVTRNQLVSVTASPYVITLPNSITLSDFQNIDVVYEKKVSGVRRVIKSTEFVRNNTHGTISIVPGIISTVISGANVVTISLSKDPNANSVNIYSKIQLSAGVSDNNIGELNDENLATVVNGFYMFRNPNTIDITLVLMGQYLNPAIVNWVISNVTEVRQDCVCFYSPPLSTVLDNRGKELEDVISFKNAVGYDSTYSFMDSGWRYQYDRYNDTFHWTPLNPDTAGLVARTAYTNDAWWSPAGFNRGKYSNVIKLAWNPGADLGVIAFSGTAISGERDDLYQQSINPVVTFTGEGTVLFGDKTSTLKPDAFSRINVRMLFILLKKAISRVSKYFLFEFNDSVTQQLYVLTVSPFLRDIEARRGIQQGGWRVICDDSINTPVVIDRNEFKAVFMIKPNRSINFIYLTFAAVSSDSSMSFSEGMSI